MTFLFCTSECFNVIAGELEYFTHEVLLWLESLFIYFAGVSAFILIAGGFGYFIHEVLISVDTARGLIYLHC